MRIARLLPYFGALFAVVLVISYLAFSLPALAAGVAVPYAGLAVVAYVYGAVVILLAIVSLVASLRRQARSRIASG